MTVDLSTLKVGDVIKLRDGSEHVVSEVKPNSHDEFMVTTETSRKVNNHSFTLWMHQRNGFVIIVEFRPRKILGDIVSIKKSSIETK